MSATEPAPASAPGPAPPHRAAGFGAWFAGFGAALVVLDFAIGFTLGRLYDTVGQGQLTGMIHSAIAAHADVLVLGASTARHHFDDVTLGRDLGLKVFNTGLDGRGIVFSRGLQALVDDERPPKLVVIDVSYSDRDRSSARLLAPFVGRSKVVDQVVGWNWRERFKLLSRAYRYNGLLLPILSNRSTPPMVSGFEPLDGGLADTTQWRGPARGAGGFGPWYATELRKLVAEARAAGSRVIFVESPTWGATVAPVALDAYSDVARDMSVPYYALTPEQYPELNDPTLYYDRAHLSRRGAVVFTRLIEPILRKELP